MQALSAVSFETFGDKFWRHPGHYQYASTTHLVPVVAGELSKAAAHLPLAFVEVEGVWQMVAVLALQPGTNLLVGPKGQWLGEYIPALLRGYPFTMLKASGGATYTLCALSEGDHLVSKDQGTPFFISETEAGPETQRMMNYLADVENFRGQMLRAVKALADRQLIVPWALMNVHEGVQQNIEGLYRLDEAAFDALSPNDLVALQAEGALPIAFAQLFSREQFSALNRAASENRRLRGSV